jgi:hypothetical protein
MPFFQVLIYSLVEKVAGIVAAQLFSLHN